MTNQELIARLLDWQEHDEGKINDTRQAAADRIKELEAKLAKAIRLMELSVELATWNTTLLEDVIDFITEHKEQSND